MAEQRVLAKSPEVGLALELVAGEPDRAAILDPQEHQLLSRVNVVEVLGQVAPALCLGRCAQVRLQARPANRRLERLEVFALELVEAKVHLGAVSQRLVVGVLDHLADKRRDVLAKGVARRLPATPRPRGGEDIEDPLDRLFGFGLLELLVAALRFLVRHRYPLPFIS